MNTELIVEGMTCEHCVRSVTEEVGDVAGVESVAVDLPSGRLTVVGGFSRKFASQFAWSVFSTATGLSLYTGEPGGGGDRRLGRLDSAGKNLCSRTASPSGG